MVAQAERAKDEAGSFAEVVRAAIRIGGCNSSRAAVAGAIIGAHHGIGDSMGVPHEWIGQIKHGRNMLALARSLVQLRDQPAAASRL